MSISASATASAASSVQPPRNTAMPGKQLLIDSPSSRSCHDSIVVRSVWCRASASRPPFSRSSRCDHALEDLGRGKDARSGGGKLDCQRELVQAPAELSDRRIRFKLRPARRTARLTSGPRRGRTGYSSSPGMRSRSLLVIISVRFGQRSSSSPTSLLLRRPLARSCRPANSSSRSPTCSAIPSLAPSVWAIVSVTSVESRSAAKPTQKTPALNARNKFVGDLERKPRLARPRPAPTA